MKLLDRVHDHQLLLLLGLLVEGTLIRLLGVIRICGSLRR